MSVDDMGKAEQQAYERRRIEEFRNTIPDFPAGEITQPDPPDFVIDGRVGIELTTMYVTHRVGTQAAQATESQRHQIVRRARQLYDQTGKPNVRVSVTFSSEAHIDKARMKQLAATLAAIIELLALEPAESCELESDIPDGPALPAEFTRIHASRPADERRTVWHVPGAVFPETLEAAAVQRVIDKKNELVPAYRRLAPEQWLVIECDVWGSSSFDIPNEVVEHIYHSTFDRVYLFRVADGQAIQLNVLNGPSGSDGSTQRAP